MQVAHFVLSVEFKVAQFGLGMTQERLFTYSTYAPEHAVHCDVLHALQLASRVAQVIHFPEEL